MNIDQLSEEKLAATIRDRVKELLKQVSQGGYTLDFVGRQALYSGYDIVMTCRSKEGPEFDLLIACRTDPRPSLFQNLAHKHQQMDPDEPRPFARILGAPFVSDRMAAVCRQHDWGWVDLAGNCRIAVPGVLVVDWTGHPPKHTRSEPTVNLGTPETGRVLHALLHLHHVGKQWTQRSLQEACVPKVSLGLVNKIVNHLEDEAFLKTTSRKGFQVIEPMSLLAAWREVYRFDLHQRHGYFTLLKGDRLINALSAMNPSDGSIALASFSSADRMAPHVRQPKTWLYVQEKMLSAFEEALEAREVESGENLVVLVPKDDGVFYKTHLVEGGGKVSATSATQTYLDLWHSGGRGQEAAEALLEQEIAPTWRNRDLNDE